MSMPLSRQPPEHAARVFPQRGRRALDDDSLTAASPADLPQIGKLPRLEARVIGAIAVFAFEAVEGSRQVAQLGRWITADVSDELREVRRLNVERRSLYRDSRRIVPVVGRVRITSPARWVTEAAVVLLTPSRARAVAMRFEVIRGRWQATSISVL
ncbi:hypothetical protein ACIFOC_01014 [Leucobacter aridicollis]|jgi:hypothetical protein|uniref:Rv3235 family protein n=1 Tax=Leucobacter aridicollis TaxID=283878 RepID=UPI0037C87573